MHLDTELVLKKIEEYRHERTCSQAVLKSFCEVAGLPTENVDKVAVGFTGGIGGTFDEGSCGALTGAVLALGYLSEDESQALMASHRLFNEFKKQYGSVTCGKISNNGDNKLHCIDVCLFSGAKVCEYLNDEKIDKKIMFR